MFHKKKEGRGIKKTKNENVLSRPYTATCETLRVIDESPHFRGVRAAELCCWGGCARGDVPRPRADLGVPRGEPGFRGEND